MNNKHPINPDNISGSAATHNPVAVQQINPKILANPKIINARTVATLIKDNQNSDSAKVRVELRFYISTAEAKVSVHTQMEI